MSTLKTFKLQSFPLHAHGLLRFAALRLILSYDGEVYSCGCNAVQLQLKTCCCSPFCKMHRGVSRIRGSVLGVHERRIIVKRSMYLGPLFRSYLKEHLPATTKRCYALIMVDRYGAATLKDGTRPGTPTNLRYLEKHGYVCLPCIAIVVLSSKYNQIRTFRISD